jgi:hypothetical protein
MIWDLRRELRRQLEEIGFVERARRRPRGGGPRYGGGGAAGAVGARGGVEEEEEEEEEEDEMETQELADPNLLKTILASALYPQVRSWLGWCGVCCGGEPTADESLLALDTAGIIHICTHTHIHI